ncbi:serine hydrolase [Phenylobacterium sp. J367]|uniref:serine hydrolase domain-containing protein n=1 Tax=Phenylobacterium sp. J367 TaxID=2898435 RepID=UPI002151325F|nr:serine hydrolase domain-containing protein [Phenylobacterium sp. J367]MCR5881161.1 beta-lactamase family protein [Phenylobacterium sp. J367]
MSYGDETPGGFSPQGLAQIPATLQGFVDQGALAGVVTLLWRKGEVAQVNTIGVRDIATKAPMTRDTLFRIASMTKPVTSVAALMLIEEGKLSLEDPITRWLPEFKDMRVLKDATGPVDATSPAPRDITVEDLFTHRGGLAYAFTSQGPIAHEHERVLGPPLAPGFGPDQWLERLASLPLSYPPGERFHYSHATEVLGFLVARIEGRLLGEVLEERIFGPLGMTDTGFWVAPEDRDRLAHLYRLDPGGLTDVSFPHTEAPIDFEAGGGGLVSTADDYLKFARMLLGKGELDGVRLLKPETVELMTKNRLTEAQRAQPFLGLPFWTAQGFGLGVSMILDPANIGFLGAGPEGSFGWPGAFGTWWQADPKNDLVAIYLIQDSMPLGPEAVTQMANQDRPSGRLALPMFQKMVYAALGQ